MLGIVCIFLKRFCAESFFINLKNLEIMIRIKDLRVTHIDVPLTAIPALLNLVFLIGVISYTAGKSKVWSVP